MNKLFDTNNNVINLQKPNETSEDTDDTNSLRSLRMMIINKELKKIEKSESEVFYNYVEREKLDLEKDKIKIVSSEEFTSYYFVNNFSTVYIELCEGDLELNNPEILAMIILFDKLYFAHKWRMRQIVNYFIKKDIESLLIKAFCFAEHTIC